MTRRKAHVCLLAGLALLVPAACKKSDTILLIEIAGPVAVKPGQFRVTVSAGMDGRDFMVPEKAKPAGEIVLPASFTIALDQSHSGPIVVSVDALDEDGSPLGFAGTTQMQHIVIGGQTVLSVFLFEVLPPQGADAGAPGDAGNDGMGLDSAPD